VVGEVDEGLPGLTAFGGRSDLESSALFGTGVGLLDCKVSMGSERREIDLELGVEIPRSLCDF